MTASNVITTDDRPPIVILRERLLERRDELRNASLDIDPDHFIRAVTTAAQINPELQACEWPSLWTACMKACRDNLLPDGREGTIVPFRDKATWIPMFLGLLKRFRQSGQCRWLTADVVRKGEKFERWIDQEGEHFFHIPGGDETTPIEKVYAAAITKDGGFYCVVLGMSEINKIKAMSKTTREDSPWKMWPSEMMKKTALRRLSKLLPAGRDLFDDEDEAPVAPPQLAIDKERLPGAAAALNQFAGAEMPPARRAGEGAGGGDTSQVSAAPTDHFDIAYGRGQVAKMAGAQRKAVPGEYREEANVRELEAWLAGYDGTPWTNPETGETLGESDAKT